jgi:hypothetical protein
MIDDFEERSRKKTGEFEKPRPVKPLQEGDRRNIVGKPTETRCKALLEKKSRNFAFKTEEKIPRKRKVGQERETWEYQTRQRESKTDSNAEDLPSETESSAEAGTNGFARGLVPEAILGASKINGEPNFLIRWKGNHLSEFVPTRIVYEYNPKMACYFYETKIIWVD